MNQNNSEELKHYGVLGMKWGRRRAQRYAEKAQAAKAKAKEYKGLVGEFEYQKKADKAVAKAKNAQFKAKAYEQKYKIQESARQRMVIADNDRRVTKYGKGNVIGADIAKSMVTAMGSSMARKFIYKTGKRTVQKMAEDGNLTKGSAAVVSALTVAGLATVTVGQLKKHKALSNDIQLALEYDTRNKIMNKKK